MIGSSFPVLLYHTFNENFSMLCVRVPVQLEQRAYSSSRNVQNYFIMINCAAQIKKIVSNRVLSSCFMNKLLVTYTIANRQTKNEVHSKINHPDAALIHQSPFLGPERSMIQFSGISARSIL